MSVDDIAYTQEQKQAIESDADVSVVIAGPGSGKTAVMVGRVYHLIQGGVTPNRILCVTFTNRAAVQLQTKTTCNQAHAGSPVCGTLHSAAFAVLRADGHKLGYNCDSLTILDEVESKLIFDQVATELRYRDAKTRRWKAPFKLAEVRQALDVIYQMGWPSASHLHQQALQFITAYHERLFSMNLLDYGMILVQSVRLLSSEPEVLNKHAARFDHVLVDESQDCDDLQFRFIKLIGDQSALFFVGDARQCIYEWRGARPGIIREKYPAATVFELTGSFRCSRPILDRANALMDKDPPMHSARRWPRPNIAVETVNGRTRDLCGLLNRLHHRDKCDWREIAVLCRTNHECRRLADVMHEARIPCHRVGSSFDITSGPPFREVYAVLRLIVNEHDEAAYARVKRLILPSGPEIDAQVRKLRVDHRTTSLGALERLCPASSLVRGLGQLDPEGPISEALNNLRRPLVDSCTNPDRMSSDDFGKVERWWHAWCPYHTVESALRWFAGRNLEDDQTDKDEVTVSTIHASKGLEWPCVLLPNLNQGSLPSAKAIREGTVAQERRVLYVAMTRAQSRLTLHWRRPQDQSDGPKTAPSEFLTEAGVLT